MILQTKLCSKIPNLKCRLSPKVAILIFNLCLCFLLPVEMSEVTNMSQSQQNCQNKHDLAMEDKGERIVELVEEPKTNPLKKRPFETSEQVPEKQLKLSPSPLMDLPNEIWMKILSFLPTYDILKNFNLTCKHFHSLATNPCAIKSFQLKLEKAKESFQYQEIVKILKRSKTLNKLVINGHGRMNHILAHGLKSNRLKTLEVSADEHFEATLSKKNAEYINNSKIECLKLNDITLDNYAMQQIGAVKTLKSFRISVRGYRQKLESISELIKTFVDAKIELEDLDIVANYNLGEIYPSVFIKFLEERGETLKKLKIHCPMNDATRKDERKLEKFSMKWIATSNLEELCYHDYGNQKGNCPIEFGCEMPKLTKLALLHINGNILQKFETQNFPVLERLHLEKSYGKGENASQQTIVNILENCPNLKSVKLRGFNVPDPQSADSWCAFLCKIYKNFNVYIDIMGYHNWSSKINLQDFEKYLKKTDSGTFVKYTKIKTDYFDWENERVFSDEWWCW